VKYVVELARALAMMPGVYRVDLFTRQVSSHDVDWSYGEPTEMLTSGSHDADGGESAGAYIVRIPCGPSNKYLKKEALWPYLQEFVDGALAHILNMSKVLGEQVGRGKPVLPYVIHGHYADAGDVAALLSGALNVPMVLTGHSLGRNKLEQIMKQGRMSKEEIDSTYKIMRRIEGEELALDAAELVITSTRQEIDEQWGLYDGFDVKLEKVLRARTRRGVSCHGRFMPRMVVSVKWQVYNFFSSVMAPYNFWQNSTKLIFEVAYVWGKQRVFRLYH
jgi:sucrose-phosphate synthase